MSIKTAQMRFILGIWIRYSERKLNFGLKFTLCAMNLSVKFSFLFVKNLNFLSFFQLKIECDFQKRL